MKKFIVPIIAVLFALVLLAGCGEKKIETSSVVSQEQQIDAMAKVLDNLFDKETSVIVQMLGEPTSKSEPSSEDNDTWSHQSWTYENDGLVIDLVDRGSGFVVSRATATNGCKLGTSKEIYVGSTEQQVRQAYGDSINEDYSFTEMGTIVVGEPSNCITFYIEDETVCRIVVGEMG